MAVETTEIGLQRLWGRRVNIHEDDITDVLEDSELFPSAVVETDEAAKSRPCSPCHHVEDEYDEDVLLCSPFVVADESIVCDTCLNKTAVVDRPDKTIARLDLDGQLIGDIPARYTVSNLYKHEFPAIGIYVDPRIVPGFKYRVKPISESGGKERWLFKGKALELQSIGRGYSRRITFVPGKGNLNDNPHYFWADSNPTGFAFELEVVSPGDKFTVFDGNHVAVADLEIIQNQGPQEEVGHRVLDDGTVEKTVRVRALSKVDWYSDDNADLVVPLRGIAVSTKPKRGVVKTKIIGASIGSHPRRGFTLNPGIDRRLRSSCVKGDAIGDVPTVYNIIGLDANELPVIGTYVDPRILPGFYYRVRPASGKRRPLFNGRPLKLNSIGMGYGKRLVFAPDSLNNPENYLWSDSHPDGLGFEPSAVRESMRFVIYAGELRLGEATVFRADAPQKELSQYTTKDDQGRATVFKEIFVDVKCVVTLDTRFDESPEPTSMRISGTALLCKEPGSSEARLVKVDNVGLDSQLNILFNTQWDHLVFLPV